MGYTAQRDRAPRERLPDGFSVDPSQTTVLYGHAGMCPVIRSQWEIRCTCDAPDWYHDNGTHRICRTCRHRESTAYNDLPCTVDACGVIQRLHSKDEHGHYFHHARSPGQR